MSEWTPELHAELRVFCGCTTPGPWRCTPSWTSLGYTVVGGDFDMTVADLQFMAAAREGVPALLDEVERLQAAVKRLTPRPRRRRREPQPDPTEKKLRRCAATLMDGDYHSIGTRGVTIKAAWALDTLFDDKRVCVQTEQPRLEDSVASLRPPTTGPFDYRKCTPAELEDARAAFAERWPDDKRFAPKTEAK